jgi:hypothetical protein
MGVEVKIRSSLASFGKCARVAETRPAPARLLEFWIDEALNR